MRMSDEKEFARLKSYLLGLQWRCMANFKFSDPLSGAPCLQDSLNFSIVFAASPPFYSFPFCHTSKRFGKQKKAGIDAEST